MNDSTPAPMTKRSVFIVDDHPLVREWLGQLVARQPDLAIAGQAETSAAAFESILQTKPEIVIVDLSLEDGSGLELIKKLQTLAEPPLSLVLSMHDETLYAERALRAGARGYVMKRAATGSVIEAIRHVLAGELYLSADLSALMAQKFATNSDLSGAAITLLSDREAEVFQMLGQGIETRRIAEKLHLSPKTVQVYCGRIKEKLGLSNATALIREAVRSYEQEHKAS